MAPGDSGERVIRGLAPPADSGPLAGLPIKLAARPAPHHDTLAPATVNARSQAETNSVICCHSRWLLSDIDVLRQARSTKVSGMRGTYVDTRGESEPRLQYDAEASRRGVSAANGNTTSPALREIERTIAPIA